MTAYFVTRHKGAVEWARRQGIEARIVPHLDPADVRAGDVVLGTLPVQLIAVINAVGARYMHLEIDIPPDKRGADLSAGEMEGMGARLVEYEARCVERT